MTQILLGLKRRDEASDFIETFLLENISGKVVIILLQSFAVNLRRKDQVTFSLTKVLFTTKLKRKYADCYHFKKQTLFDGP